MGITAEKQRKGGRMTRNLFSAAIAALAIAFCPAVATAEPSLYYLDGQFYLFSPDDDAATATMPEAELFVQQDLLGQGGAAGTLGVYAFALLNRGPGDLAARWGQTQFGVTYWLVDGLQVAVGPALEQGPSAYRLTAYAFLDPSVFSNISAFVTGEYGFDNSDDYYYTSNFGYHLGPVRIGGMFERFLGVGPRVDLSIAPAHLRVHGNNRARSGV